MPTPGDRRWPEYARIVGFLFVALGGVDPLEGSVLALAGSALLALGTWRSGAPTQAIRFRAGLFGAMVLGVGALYGISFLGGFGGDTGRSAWWALPILPYPLAWSLSLWGGRATPRWVLVAGGLVSAWYFFILAMMWSRRGADTPAEMLWAPVFLAGLGAVTLAGCVWRSRADRRSSPS